MLSPLNLTIILGFIALTTWLGHRASRGTSTSRGFFQAEGGMPWWAVSLSLVATYTSTVTFIAVPTAVFIAGGNLTYAQAVVGFGLGIAVIPVAFGAAFWEEAEARTIIDFIARRTRREVADFTLVWGYLSSVLGNCLRLLAAALVLSVVARTSLLPCIIVMAALSAAWSGLAGIRTVVWTDVGMFFVFILGALFCLAWLTRLIPADLAEIWALLDAHGKLVWLDLSLDPGKSFTVWTALFGASVMQLGTASAQGTFQRIRSCRNEGEARRAYLWAAVFSITPFLMMAVGLGLFAYYQSYPLGAEAQAQLTSQPDRILPHFIITELPDGVSGLLIVALLAAGVSTLNSVLAEPADLTVNNVYRRFVRPEAPDAHYVTVSRRAIFLWAFLLSIITWWVGRYQEAGLLQLAFQLPGYVAGVNLGTLLLARLRFRPARRAYFTAVIASGSVVFFLGQVGVNFWWWYPAGVLALLGITTFGTRLLERMSHAPA